MLADSTNLVGGVIQTVVAEKLGHKLGRVEFLLCGKKVKITKSKVKNIESVALNPKLMPAGM
jgi:hypothetical protein